MSIVIKLVEYKGQDFSMPGQEVYIKSFDADAFDGGGDMEYTPKIEEAIRFPNFGQAWDFYKTQSTVRPLRQDGLPNRPLTAFTVMFALCDKPAP